MLVRLLYTVLLTLAAPLLLLGLYRSKPNKPKFGKRWKEHFGATPALASNSQPIWIHAVSVGESIAAVPLIKKLKKQHPETPIVVTTTTSTGAEQVAKLGDLVEHRYMPLDFSFAVRHFLKIINPSKMLIIETELWPNTLHTVHESGIPIYVINARLSEKSMKGYAKIPLLFNQIEKTLTKVLCQFESDRQHFRQLGVAECKLEVTGSIKFDIDITPEIKQKGRDLRERLGSDRPIWIAASTHEGEDEQILNAHQSLLAQTPNALLILVPRHPERFKHVAHLAQHLGFSIAKHSALNSKLTPETQVYIGDVMGEMLTLIGASDVCFMAGSLIGDKVGGHNILEPVALEVPVVTGPSYYNFQKIVDDMRRANLIEICKGENLSIVINTYIHNIESFSYDDFSLSYIGSTDKTIHFIMDKTIDR